jgi:DNA-binding NtrC family response regulator/predicted hydrocarbon binding protein
LQYNAVHLQAGLVNYVQKEELQVFSLLEFRPEQGAIFCRDERMLVVSALAFGALQTQLLASLGPDATREALHAFGYRHGFHHYLGAEELFGKEHMGSVVGPRIPELMGFFKAENVKVQEGQNPPSFHISLHYRNSVEAEQYLLNSGISTFPVCWWSVAFASGYCSAAFGLEIYFNEGHCAAQGGDLCKITGQDVNLWGAEKADRFRAEYGFANEDEVHVHWREFHRVHCQMRKQREALLGIPADRGNIQQENPSRKRASESSESANFIVREDSMLDALEQAISVARLDMPVLVQGETGSGKEFVINLIHRQSARAERDLISVNCAALTETLLETELFGHVRGAFTGAVSEKPGLFEFADGGTLFLDEIGEMPPALQAKLLRVLENGEIRRVGSTRTLHANVRVLAATHRNLLAMVDAGEFRRDLYFRLNSFVIHLPALRERPESIPAMVHAFLGEMGHKSGKQVHTVTPEVMTRLLEYEWPGNVRELKHAIERAVLVASDGVLRLRDLPAEITSLVKTTKPVISECCLNLKQGEQQVIEQALAQHAGNRMATATALNISVSTLWRKMRRYQML